MGSDFVKKPKEIFECWLKDKTRVSMGVQNTITRAFQVPNHSLGKDEYVVDMTGYETQYCQGTELGLLGSFEFQGTCTGGDGSYDTGSRSMGSGFCNFSHLGWNTETPLPPSSVQDQHTLNSNKVGREDDKDHYQAFFWVLID